MAQGSGARNSGRAGTGGRQTPEPHAHLAAQTSDILRLTEAVGATGAWRWDRQTGEIEWTPGLFAIYGVDPERFVPTVDAVRGLIHDEDYEAARRAIHRLAEGASPQSTYFRIVRPDGAERVVESMAEVVAWDGDRRPLVIVGADHDVTDRTRAEEALRESEQRYRALVDQAVDGVFLADDSGRYIDANRAGLDMLGYDLEELRRLSVNDLVVPEEAPRMPEQLSNLGSGGVVTSEWLFRRKDGSTFHGEVVGRRLSDGRMLGILRDISGLQSAEQERLAAEQVIRDREARLEILNEANSLLLATDDPESVIQAIGEKAMDYLEADVFFNYVLDEGAERLRLNACGGVDQRIARAIERLELGQAICGCVARDGKRIISNDVQHNGDARADLVRRMGVRTYVCHPIRIGEQTIGTLSFGSKRKDRFTDDEIDLMRAITAQVSIAVHKARLFEEQRVRRHRIEALHSVMEVAVSSIDVREASQCILDHLSGHFDFELCSIWLDGGEHLERVAQVGYPPDYLSRLSVTDPYDAVTAYRTGQHLVVRTPDNPAVLAAYERMGLELHAYSVLPLKARGRVIGVLNLVWSHPREINAYDEAFFDSVADEIGVVLENLRLYEAERRIAETLQETLVVVPYSLPDIDFSRAYESATEQGGRVGGDFVDLFEVAPGRVGIVVGDVSGKGVDAAVITSLVRNTVRAHAVDGLPPATVCEKTNKVMHRFSSVEAYVTMFFGLLDTGTGLLRYVSAGHPPAVVVSAHGFDELSGRAPILGAFDDVRFPESQAVLCTGDRLLLYTDGVSEAKSPGDAAFFGVEGLRAAVERLERVPTTRLAEDLMREVVEFSDGTLRDDAAMLVVEPTGLSV